MEKRAIFKFLQPLLNGHPYNVNNSKDVIDKLKNETYDTNITMYSLDVQSLYPNTAVEKAINLIKDTH